MSAKRAFKLATVISNFAYNAFVLPVLLFNAGAWGVCESVIKKIEVFHRKQLRRVLGVRWPFKISNKEVRC